MATSSDGDALAAVTVGILETAIDTAANVLAEALAGVDEISRVVWPWSEAEGEGD